MASLPRAATAWRLPVFLFTPFHKFGFVSDFGFRVSDFYLCPGVPCQAALCPLPFDFSFLLSIFQLFPLRSVVRGPTCAFPISACRYGSPAFRPFGFGIGSLLESVKRENRHRLRLHPRVSIVRTLTRLLDPAAARKKFWILHWSANRTCAFIWPNHAF